MGNFNITGLQSSFIQTSFGKMHYYDSDPHSNLVPLIFLHGLGSSGKSWWILAKMLRNKTRILLPDLFHMSGQSEATVENMDFFDHANSLHEFLTAITNANHSTKKVNLCGLSLGGWLALYLAATYPDDIQKTVIMNPSGIKINPFMLRDTIKHINWAKFRKLYPGVLRAFPFTRAPFVSRIIRRAMYRKLKMQKVKDFLDATKREHFVDDILSNITCEVLLLWGREDQLISNRTVEVLITKIKNITAKWIFGCAHVLSLEAPVNCYHEMNSFLKLSSIKENFFATTVLFFGHRYPAAIIKIGDFL